MGYINNKKLIKGFEEYFYEDIRNNYDTDDYISVLENNMLFVTYSVCFNEKHFGASRIHSINNYFENALYHYCRKNIDYRLNQKRYKHPSTLYFIDFEGSRSFGYNIKGRQDMHQPHIHAVHLFYPETIDKFKVNFCRENINKIYSSNLYVKSLDFQNFSAEKGSLENLIRYCGKAYFKSNKNYGEVADLFNFLPAGLNK